MLCEKVYIHKCALIGFVIFKCYTKITKLVLFPNNLCSQNVHDIFDKYSLYCSNGTSISLREFQRFLLVEHQDRMGEDEIRASQFIRDYLRDPQRDVYEPYFTLNEVRFVFQY